MCDKNKMSIFANSSMSYDCVCFSTSGQNGFLEACHLRLHGEEESCDCHVTQWVWLPNRTHVKSQKPNLIATRQSKKRVK